MAFSAKRIGRIVIPALLFVLLILAAYLIFVPWSNEVGRRVQAQLLVNGQVVDDNNIVIYQHGSDYFSDLPLTAVVEALGNRVTREEDGSCLIEIGGKSCTLTGDKLFSSDGKLICQVPGYDIAGFDREGTPGELYLDQTELKNVLNLMGISPVDIEIDPHNRKVFVDA